MDEIAQIKMVLSVAVETENIVEAGKTFPSELKKSNYSLSLSSAFKRVIEVFMVSFGGAHFGSFVLMLRTSSCRPTSMTNLFVLLLFGKQCSWSLLLK